MVNVALDLKCIILKFVLETILVTLIKLILLFSELKFP